MRTKKPKITKAIIDSAFAKAAEFLRKPRKGLNRPLLRQAAAVIEKEINGVKYDQTTLGEFVSNGFCGTACCIAGEFNLLSGLTPDELLALSPDWYEYVPKNLHSYWSRAKNAFDEEFDFDESIIWETGKRLAGLSQEQSDRLFISRPAHPFGWDKEYATRFVDDPNLAAARYLRAIASGKVKL